MFKRLVKRKWGWYLTILDRKHFKVKLLWFRRHSRCSLQYHKLRNELWLFLWGNGYWNWHWPMVPETLEGKEAWAVQMGEFKSVPMNQEHMYRADKNTLVLEIQYGEKCDEEDIVRL